MHVISHTAFQVVFIAVWVTLFAAFAAWVLFFLPPPPPQERGGEPVQVDDEPDENLPLAA